MMQLLKKPLWILALEKEHKINLDLDGVKKVNVKAVTGGIIELSGNAINQDVVIMSGGILNAKI